MDLNDSVWEVLKNSWGLITTGFSIILSYIVYRHKQTQQRLEDIEEGFQEHHVVIKVFEERFINIDEMLSEIKADLKKILYKI